MSIVPLAALDALERVVPDVDLIAENLTASAHRHGKTLPPMSLAQAITSVQVTHIKVGSPTMTVTLADPEWALLDSGFLDSDADGILDRIELVYPVPDDSGIDWRWVLTQVTPNGNDHTIQCTFWSHYADALTRINAKDTPKLAPVKVARGQVTRAQFLKMLASKVPGLEFYCQHLKTHQPIDGAVQASTKSSIKQPATKGHKTVGVGANHGNLTVKGHKPSAAQVEVANKLLGIAEQHGLSTTAKAALIFAGIWESTLGEDLGWNAGNAAYGGVLAGSYSNFAHLGSPGSDAVTLAEATAFCTGGSGYNSVKTVVAAHPSGNICDIATAVEGCYAHRGATSFGSPSQYRGQSGYTGDSAAIPEAQAWVGAGGGAMSGPGSVTTTTVTVEPYYFAVGTSSDANESYWAAMQRTAQEVNWPLILVGNRIYYDDEVTLARAKPAAHVKRDTAPVSSWSYTWDARAICSGMKLDLFCGPFDYAAGDVVTLEKFGTASTASPVKLPGRWLVQQIDRNLADLFSTLTLSQPSPPKREPAPQVQTSTSTHTTPSPANSSANVGAVFGAGTAALGVLVKVASGADRAGVGLHSWVLGAVAMVAKQIGHPLTIGCGTNHSYLTVDGNVSDHWDGNAADIPASGAALTALGQGAERAFGQPVDSGGLHTFDWTAPNGQKFRMQLIFNTMSGGNHYTHLHLGIKPITTNSSVRGGGRPVGA